MKRAGGGGGDEVGGSLAVWVASFHSATADLPSLLGPGASHEAAASRLRRLVRSGILKLTDVRDNPERFFAAHRVLSEFATRLGPGFGIRFTVQFNLFAGTVVALGGQDHIELLKQVQAEGHLGCFGLTEKFAGVNSGLVVETTCTWDEPAQEFELHSPYEGAQKNWISQGCTADWAVVIADLVVDGKRHGAHGFLMRMRGPSGELMEGVSVTDMGRKTIGNDLDNAAIQFNRVRLPPSALLDRYCTIKGGRYVQRQATVSNIDMIGQRLYTGRIVIAESAIVFARSLFESTRRYSDQKSCWAPNGRMPLSEIPQLKALYAEADGRLSRLGIFLRRLQEQMSPLLREGKPPPRDVIEAIAAGKVSCIETAIELCHRLKQEVGSFALMGSTGFERTDYLQCCKFAEGDSRILMQKIARDRVAGLVETPAAQQGSHSSRELRLTATLAQAFKEGGLHAWDANWRTVYELAEVVIDRVVSNFIGRNVSDEIHATSTPMAAADRGLQARL